jgi:two-component system LytT family response regulator
VVVADDEPAARRGVRQLLAAFPEFAIVGECRDGREVLAALDRLQPDVLFLDIQMPEIDGFEVIRRRTPERMPAVVFLTAYDRFAIRAFDAEAHDYLVKPVTEARFAATMRRLARRLGPGAASREPQIVVSTPRGARVVPLQDIDWIEAADNYARIWMGDRSVLLRESLGQLEGRVRRHGFARAHRRALVRIAGVRSLHTDKDDTLVAVLECGASIAVSRRRRAAFCAAVRRQ